MTNILHKWTQGFSSLFASNQNNTVFEQYLEEASDAIYIVDISEKIVFANKSAHALLGYPYPELNGCSMSTIVQPSIKGNPFAEGLPGTADAIFQLTYIRKNGTAFTGELSAKIFSEGGHLGIVRDVSRAVDQRDTLVNSENKLRALIENSFDIVILLNRHFIVQYISPSLEDSLGYHPGELLGKPVNSFIEFHDRKLIYDLLKSSGITYRIEDIRLKHKDKFLKHFEINAINLLHQENIRGIIVNCHDIHDRVHFEEQLKNTNYELDSFVYRVSHDLKAPLRSILGLLSLASKESSVETLHIYNEMMKRSVEGLDRFIHELTQFSRNSRLDIQVESIDFTALVREVLFQIQYLNLENKIEIRQHIIQNLEFFSDKHRIHTILANLLSNAYKYHRFENNNPYIEIDIKVDSGGVEIIVLDNGSGIDEQYQTKVFDMFYRASEQSTGSGLGLYIVKSAIERLQGEIQLESIIGKGTKIKVELPNKKKLD